MSSSSVASDAATSCPSATHAAVGSAVTIGTRNVSPSVVTVVEVVNATDSACIGMTTSLPTSSLEIGWWLYIAMTGCLSGERAGGHGRGGRWSGDPARPASRVPSWGGAS